jgi:hypothetical protein
MSCHLRAMQASVALLTIVNLVSCGQIEKINQDIKDLRSGVGSSEKNSADQEAVQENPEAASAAHNAASEPELVAERNDNQSESEERLDSEVPKDEKGGKDASSKQPAVAKDVCSDVMKSDPAKLITVNVPESNAKIARSIVVPVGKSLLIQVEGSNSLVQYAIVQAQDDAQLHGGKSHESKPASIPAVCVKVAGNGNAVQLVAKLAILSVEVAVSGDMNKIFVDAQRDGMIKSLVKIDTGTSNQIKYRSYERERGS